MQIPVALDIRALSNFDLAVLRFTPGGTCIFANAAGIALLGTNEPLGIKLETLFPGEEEHDTMIRELQKRMSGEASSYPTVVTRPLTGERIPISIFAFPEAGTDGLITGLIAFVRDLREEVASRAIHDAVATMRSDRSILQAVANEVARLIPFDEFRVVAISSGRRHLRTIFSTDTRREERYPFKWWPLPRFLLNTIDSQVARPIDVAEMFSDPDYAAMAANDPQTRAYRDSGVRYSLSIPIFYRDRIAAFVGIDTRGARPYTEEELNLCLRLPLPQAVLIALHFEEQAKLRSCVDLIRELGNEDSDVRRVAQTLTERLAASFGWDDVAVFQHDEDIGRFRVLSRSGGNGGEAGEMDADQGPPSDRGIVAQSFHTQSEINIPDIAEYVKTHRGRGLPEYLPGVEGMSSELAMPIPGETNRWVLNVESRLGRAFADEEIEILRLLAVEAGHILERAAMLEMREAILSSINDAVIETDRRGVLRKVNPAAERILGASQETLAGMSLGEFVADAELSSAILNADSFARREVEIVSLDRSFRTWTLLSGSRLPENLGGRVFVASDLNYEREVQKTEMLKEVFRNAALESRLPLALAAGWLEYLPGKDGETQDITRKVLKQMRKADMPLERLLRLATPNDVATGARRPVELNAFVDEVIHEWPRSERRGITYVRSSSHVPALVAREALRFCIESALSFSLRTKPQDKQVEISVHASDRNAVITVRGDWIPDLGPSESLDIRNRWRRRTFSDLALASGEMETILEQCHGQFRSELVSCVMFEMALPLSEHA